MKRCPITARKQHSTASPAGLFTPRQIDEIQENYPTFLSISDWVRSYLAKPHAELGRSGTVCPFAPEALTRDTIRITVVRLNGPDRSAEIESAVRHYKTVFTQMEPAGGEAAMYKALLVVFPDVSLSDAHALIDASKERLKPLFVDEGLMLGEFHELNESPGLHNPDFRPLRSPIPMLAIRHMVYSDLVFLNRSDDPVEKRIRFVESYLNQKSVLRPQDRELAQKVLDDLKAALPGF